jgi:hypothetical protein
LIWALIRSALSIIRLFLVIFPFIFDSKNVKKFAVLLLNLSNCSIKVYFVFTNEIQIVKSNMKENKKNYKRDIKCLKSKSKCETNKLIDQKILNKM